MEYSNGTPVVAEYPTGSMADGTISIVNIKNGAFTVTGDIKVGHHPTGMALWGKNLLVANTYDDTISVIDTTSNTHVGTINLGLPIGIPGDSTPPTVRDRTRSQSMPQEHRLRRALQRQRHRSGRPRQLVGRPRQGHDSGRLAPASVALDTANNELLVANDKGWGSTGNPTPANAYFNGIGVTGAPTTRLRPRANSA